MVTSNRADSPGGAFSCEERRLFVSRYTSFAAGTLTKHPPV
jgi:hypothetical protein